MNKIDEWILKEDLQDEVEAELKEFMASTMLTIQNGIVGIERGYSKDAIKQFGRKNVLRFLDLLENKYSYLIK